MSEEKQGPSSSVGSGHAEDSPGPALWNPNAAASWSLIFSPIFGSILQMKNWQALGQAEKASRSRKWAKISVAVLALMVVASFILPESNTLDGISRLAGLVLLLSWYYAHGKEQNAYVLARFGQGYARRGWGKPIGLALLCLLAFVAAVAMIVVVVDLVAGGA